jgi:hypothetical protein
VIQNSYDSGREPTPVDERSPPLLLLSPPGYIQPPHSLVLSSSQEMNPSSLPPPTQRTLTVPEALARFSNRALPPLPLEASSTTRNMIDLPRQAELAGHQSPSVRDLRARSVVSNRVAAMQVAPLTNSTPPALSTRTQQLPRIPSKLREETPLAYFRPPLAATFPVPTTPVSPSKEHDIGVQSVLESYYSHSPSPSFADKPRPAPSPPSSLSPLPSSHTATSQRSSVVSSWSTKEQQARQDNREAIAAEVIQPVLDALGLHALSHDNQAAALRAQVGALTEDLTRIVDAVDGTLRRPDMLGDDHQAETLGKESREVLNELIKTVEDIKAGSMLQVPVGATLHVGRLAGLLKEQGRDMREDIAEVTRRLEELKVILDARPEGHQVVLSRLDELLEIHRTERLNQSNSETRGDKSTWPSDAGIGPQVRIQRTNHRHNMLIRRT